MMKKICKLILSKKFTLLGKYCFSAIAFSTIAFSCSEEQPGYGPENVGGEEQEIVFSMNLPSASDATSPLRSIGEAQENTIQTVDLIAFRKDNATPTYYYHYTGRVAEGNTPGAATQKIQARARIERFEQDLVIITNARTFVENAVNSLTEGQTISKEEFLAKLEYELTGTNAAWKTISASNYDALPMWGEVSATITQNSTQLSMSLLRMLATIDVRLDPNKLSELTKVFKLKSVRLYNTYSKGRIVPATTAISTTGNSVIAPTIPANAVKNVGPLVYQDFTAPGVTDVSMKGAIYTFETKAPASTDDRMGATYLVIGGIYGTGTTETYYRVDFVDIDKKFQDILRNHRYLVNITSVTGPGDDTPVQAGNNGGVNMDVNILNWDQSNMYDVVFDGQWYLSVSRDSVIVSRENQENTDLTILTDYKPIQGRSGWYIESILDDATHATCTWLTADPMSGPPETLNTVKVTTTYNSTGRNRSATIMFVAGRLRYPVKVIQSTLERASITVVYVDTKRDIPAVIDFPIIVGQKNAPIHVHITWTPKNANLVVYEWPAPGIAHTYFDYAPGIIGVNSEDNGENGVSVSIAPRHTVSEEDIRRMPNYLLGTKLIFEVSNGLNTATKEVVLRHIYR